jgi:type IV secretion system protein VirB8
MIKNKEKSAESKSGPDAIKKHYVQLKSGWDKDRNAFIAMQRNFFILLSLVSMGGVITAMIVIKSMVEKNAIEPYVISVNTADKMPIAINSQSVKDYAKANPAVIEFFLIKYVKSREGYEFGTYNYDYNTVAKTMSTYEVYQQFRKTVLNDDKNNPFKLFGKDGRVEVIIKQITHTEKSAIATIRIAKKVYISDTVRTILNYQIKLHYNMETANLKVSDIEINPLGIIVDTYDVTEEKTIVEDETFKL